MSQLLTVVKILKSENIYFVTSTICDEFSELKIPIPSDNFLRIGIYPYVTIAYCITYEYLK